MHMKKLLALVLCGIIACTGFSQMPGQRRAPGPGADDCHMLDDRLLHRCPTTGSWQREPATGMYNANCMDADYRKGL